MDQVVLALGESPRWNAHVKSNSNRGMFCPHIQPWYVCRARSFHHCKLPVGLGLLAEVLIFQRSQARLLQMSGVSLSIQYVLPLDGSRGLLRSRDWF